MGVKRKIMVLDRLVYTSLRLLGLTTTVLQTSQKMSTTQKPSIDLTLRKMNGVAILYIDVTFND